MPYVKTIPYEEAQGELKEAYDMMIKTRGRISNVQAVSSLKPNIMKTLMAHVGPMHRPSVVRTPNRNWPSNLERISATPVCRPSRPPCWSSPSS